MSDNVVTQLPPTLSVKDPDTRAFLDALVNHLELRGGNTNRESPERFVTLGELQTSINGRASSLSMLGGGSGGVGPGGPIPGGPGGGTVEELIGRLEDWIKKGFLYQFLQSPIQYIDMGPFKEIAAAGIQTESFARSNKDNAIAGAVNTIWAAIGNDGALIQDGQLASVSPVAVSAVKWTQVQSAVIDNSTTPPTNKVAAVRQDFETYVGKTDGKLRAAYGVRVEVGADGRKAAGGFGIVAELDQATGKSFIDFGVVADRFWIAPPATDDGDHPANGAAAKRQIPFIVLTTPRTVDGVNYPAGTYIRNANIANAAIDTAKIKDAAIDTAKIRDLSVDTLKIAGRALTRTQVAQGIMSGLLVTTTPWSVESPGAGILPPYHYTISYWGGIAQVDILIPESALSSGSPVTCAITCTSSFYPVDSSQASVVVGVAHFNCDAAGVPIASSMSLINQWGAATYGGNAVNITGIATFDIWTSGAHAFILGARLQAGPDGSWSPPGGKVFNGQGTVLVQGAFR